QHTQHCGPQLLQAAVAHSPRWLPGLSPRSLAVLLLALADLGAEPGGEWTGLALETAHRKLAGLDPPSAVAVLWAVSRFERARAAAAAAAAEAGGGGAEAAEAAEGGGAEGA
ncbi:hypothetical protein Agub_g6091, partial [Astrephomene gubernaculifera]